MNDLNREGQETLVVIMTSDVPDEDVDDDGNIIKVFVAKDQETRSMQERSICERLEEWNPNIDSSKFQAISVSTLLAQEAFQTEDDEKFRASGIDNPIQRLGNKITDRAIELKRQNQQRLINNHIDALIESLSEIEEKSTQIKNVAEISIQRW